MNETAGIALLYLMFGQFLVLSFGILVLWWMSEPGAAWNQSRADRRARAKETALAMPEASVQAGTGAQVVRLQTEVNARPAVSVQPSTGSALLALARDHSVGPEPAKDRSEKDHATADTRDHAVQA